MMLSKLRNNDVMSWIAIIFIVIASFSGIIDFMNLKSFSRTFQLLIVGLYLILVWGSNDERQYGTAKLIRRLSGFLLLYLVVRLIIDIFISHTDSRLIFICFSQLFMLYFWIYAGFRSAEDVVDKVLHYCQLLFWVGILFSVVEFFIPQSSMTGILLTVFGGVVPDSYFSRDLQYSDSLRLGSFYLSPLTFAFTCLFLLCFYKVDGFKKSKWIVTALITVLAKTKSSLMGGVLFLAGKYSRVMNFVLLALVLLAIVILPTVFTGWDFYYNYDGTDFKSTANHLSGLVFGLRSAFEHPFWGSGLGTSGYLVYLETLANPGLPGSPFIFEIPYQNGNESTLGVIGYQLGGIFLMIHLTLFLTMFKYQMENRNYVIATFILLSLLFQILTESSLTLLVSIAQAFLFCKTSHVETIEDI
jgi:hypothetical protein